MCRSTSVAIYGIEIRENAEWASLIQRTREADLINFPPKQPPTLDESIERMKIEIIEDVRTGQVPADCSSFSALHDYVDANCYGGFCEDNKLKALIEHFGGRDEDEGMPDALMVYLNAAQNAIDRWIKEGGLKQIA